MAHAMGTTFYLVIGIVVIPGALFIWACLGISAENDPSKTYQGREGLDPSEHPYPLSRSFKNLSSEANNAKTSVN